MQPLAAHCGASAAGFARAAQQPAASPQRGGRRSAVAHAAPCKYRSGEVSRVVRRVSPPPQRPVSTHVPRRSGDGALGLARAFSAGRGWLRVAAAAAGGDHADVPDAVANAITGSTPEDVECLDEILSAGAWDDVQQCVRGLAMQGRVTPGVLAAAEKVLAKMQERSDADIDVVKSVSAVVELIKATIDALARLAPKSKLAESLTALDPNIPSERALMKELMDLAFDVNTGEVDRLDFIEDMVFFIKSADEQDAGFLAAVAEGRVDLGEMTLEDVMLVRRQGRERMSQIVDMMYGYDAAEEKK